MLFADKAKIDSRPSLAGATGSAGAAASSMIKTATLSDADYSRIIDYWKNELGYGDQEWIDALFTKKYDK